MWPASASTSVEPLTPAPPCTTTPGGFSTKRTASSSYATAKGTSHGTAAGASGAWISACSPAATRWFFGRAEPSTRTNPASISRWARERDPSGPARYASRRSPACGVSTSSRIATRPRRLERVEEAEHAEGDRHVGHVEGRPQRQVDEVGHRVAPEPVDEVADGAAQQQPRRQ